MKGLTVENAIRLASLALALVGLAGCMTRLSVDCYRSVTGEVVCATDTAVQ